MLFSAPGPKGEGGGWGTSSCFRSSNLVVADALSESDTAARTAGALEFAIHGSEPYAGRFVGIIGCDELTGTFTFNSGKTLAVRLPRQLPYWER